MTHEETIQRIQSLVPSIMELEFGCDVEEKPAFDTGMRCDTFNGEKVFTIISKYSSKDSWFYLTDIGLGKEKEDKILNWHKILGKPITLAVIMLAIIAKYTEIKDVWFVYDLRQTQRSVLTHWNLSQDNFNDQSDETKVFIGGLRN